MWLSKILPKKFSSRLFWMTFIAGLIPICIFAVLLEMYGREFQPRIRQTIQQTYDEAWAHNETLLQQAVWTLIQQKAVSVAMELDLTLQSYPYMTLEDLQRDKEFRKIAIQPVGQTGYTSLHDSFTGAIRFHADRALENKKPHLIKRKFPSLWSIIEKSLGKNHASGYYEWTDQNGETKQKYMYIAPLQRTTADKVSLSVAVTASVDEFTQPIRDAQAIHRRTADRLGGITDTFFRSIRKIGLLYMGLGLLIVSLIASGVGRFFSRSITELREATQQVNEGNFDVSIKPSMSGEVRTLTEDFNRMVRQLATTTVSKRLLEESEGRLIEANYDLRHEINIRMLAEKALAAEKERLAVTLHSIGDGVITTDTKGRIVLINDAAETLTGWPQAEAQGRRFSEVFHSIDEKTRTPSGDPVQTIVTMDKPILFERTEILIGRDGLERIVALSGTPIRDNDQTILGVVIVFRDVTEKRKMEEELLTARKLESVGTLAGGVAHDFNNLLAVILGNISFAKMLITDPSSKIYDRLTDAEDATIKGKELTYRLLDFSRGGGESSKKVTSLKGIIKDSARLTLSGSNIKCTFTFPDGLWQVEIDEEQIRQVIHNIVMNAKETTAQGGKIVIRADNITLRPEDTVPLPEGNYVKISIEDHGGGIPEEDLSRVFDPYFTTKEIGNVKGTGLGLAICYSIIKNHGGFMTAESQPGVGTTIHVYLPVYKEETPDARPGREKPVNVGGCRVLYMDDENALRDVAGEMLCHMGYDVEFARDGVEAIKMYSEAMASKKPFDIVIMDLTIPDGMGGAEAVQKLREIDPGVKAIVSSGYSTDPIVKDFKKYNFSGVIAKPFDVDELVRVIESVLADGPKVLPAS
jgi:PAS domain S-box-containing protein